MRSAFEAHWSVNKLPSTDVSLEVRQTAGVIVLIGRNTTNAREMLPRISDTAHRSDIGPVIYALIEYSYILH